VEDSIAAARWIASSPEALGREVTGLVTCGDSAGGNFAIVVSLALRDEPAAVPVLAQWPIYPAADPSKGYPSFQDFGEGYLLTRAGMRWFDECYAADPKDWRFSPLLKSQAGMPPTLVLTASLDPSATRAAPTPPPASRRACQPCSAKLSAHPRLHQPPQSRALFRGGHQRLRRSAEADAGGGASR
jgi:acetyl esterase/lipase